MHGPSAHIAKRSFDRPNLAITIHAKIGLQQDLKFFVKGLCRVTGCAVGGDAGGGMGSTIVYTPTRCAAEEVAAYLRTRVLFWVGTLGQLTTAGAKNRARGLLPRRSRDAGPRAGTPGLQNRTGAARECERWCRRGCVLGR